MATSILELSADRAVEGGAKPEDLLLVEHLRKGHECAYEELISRFQQPVYLLAIRLLGDSSEAADMVQEVFLKVFRNIGQDCGQRANSKRVMLWYRNVVLPLCLGS